MNFNKFIDFKEIFNFLIKENQDELNKYYYESDTYRKIFDFVIHFINDYDILNNDCEFTDKTILFVFEKIINIDNIVSSVYYTIVYDKLIHEFISCEIEL